ncbi:hypothetical protein [Streptomyces sp. NPDC002602]|uniref:ISAzo13-like element transposase-related protein n=1 Tax=Streptomyces sp. NPDC002602 TaxID=3364654 RepID=UPI0036944E1F
MPYGIHSRIHHRIHDIAANTGRVSVGTEHDTTAFAVASTRRSWRPEAGPTVRPPPPADHCGRRRVQRLPHPSPRAWKTELALLAAKTGSDITLCPTPPGTQRRCSSIHRACGW